MRLRKPAVIAAVLIAASAVSAGIWLWWAERRFVESTDNAYVEADVSTLAPRVSGFVREVHVTDNQRVAAGDVLVTLDDRELTARVDAARAQLAARQAALASHDMQVTVQAALVARAVAEVAAADVERHRAGLDRVRYRQLAAREATAQQRNELADADARKADAALNAAHAALAAERKRFELVKLQADQVRAAVREAEAMLDQAVYDAENAVIRAPVAGIVANRVVRIGQYVRPGTPLLAVVPLHATYIVANFKETQVERMRPGQTAHIRVDAYPDRELTGRIESLAPASGARFTILPPENASGNFTKIVQRIPVRIAVEAAQDGMLRMGMSVVVSVDVRSDRPMVAHAP